MTRRIYGWVSGAHVYAFSEFPRCSTFSLQCLCSELVVHCRRFWKRGTTEKNWAKMAVDDLLVGRGATASLWEDVKGVEPWGAAVKGPNNVRLLAI